MSSPKFYWNPDINNKQLVQARLENLTSNPTNPKSGRIYYNTTDEKIWFYKNSAWQAVGSIHDIKSTDKSININNAEGIVDIEVNVDKATINIKDNGEVYISDEGVDTLQLADNAVTTIKIIDGAITFNKVQQMPTMTLLGNITSSSNHPQAITIIDDPNLLGGSNQNIPTTGAVIAYINNAVSGLGVLQGGWDASSGLFPGTSDTSIGDYWYVTVSGIIGGISYEVGDILVASIANPTTQSDYTHIKLARGQATATIIGVVKLSTDEQAKAMSNTENALTPSNLEAIKSTEAEALDPNNSNSFMTPKMVHMLLSSFDGKKFSTTFGDGIALDFTFTHNLNTDFVMFELRNGSTRIFASPTAYTLNSITFNFAIAPASETLIIVWS